MKKFIIILLLALIIVGCNSEPKRFNSEDYTPHRDIKPPAPAVNIKSDTNARDIAKDTLLVVPKTNSTSSNTTSYYRSGTYTFGYIYDIRASSTISRQSGLNQYSVKVVTHEDGSLNIVGPDDTPGKHNLLRAVVGQNMTISKPTTFFKYDLFYEQPHMMSFGHTEWVPVTLYIIKGELKAVRVDNHIYADTQVDLQIVKQNDVYRPSEENVVESNVYIVKKGDTLAKIARINGTTVDAIKKRNNLRTNIIHPNQKLYVR